WLCLLAVPLTLAGLTGSAGAVNAPSLTKSFAPPSIPLGGTTKLSFTITNTDSATTLHSAAFSDTLPADLTIANPAGVTGSCSAGSNVVVTTTPGGSTINVSGTLTPSAGCTFSVNITVATTGTTGTKVNTTSTVTSTEAPEGAAATANLTVVKERSHDFNA